jgi:hypothetical protein
MDMLPVPVELLECMFQLCRYSIVCRELGILSPVSGHWFWPLLAVYAASCVPYMPYQTTVEVTEHHKKWFEHAWKESLPFAVPPSEA